MDENEKSAVIAMVVAYHEKHGFEMVMSNWECVDGGFDLVMTQGNEIHFIDITEGGPIDAETVERVRAAASRFMMTSHVYSDCDAHYDLASFSDYGDGGTLSIDYDCVDFTQDSLEKLLDDMRDWDYRTKADIWEVRAFADRLDKIIKRG